MSISMTQESVKLEKLGDLLFERASKHVYEDLINVGIANLREEFAVKGLARSSSFVRAVTESVFERLGSLKPAFLKSYVEPAQNTQLGITPTLEEWLRHKWNEVWERAPSGKGTCLVSGANYGLFRQRRSLDHFDR
jgi:hypothetical protein